MGMSPLPVELIVRILGFLPFKDIVICTGVSRQFREVVDTSSTLAYILELGLCGLVDSGQCSLTVSERLLRLRQREAAWSVLEWQSAWEIPLNKKYMFWEICGNIFAGTYFALPNLNSVPALSRSRAFNVIDLFKLESEPPESTGPTKQMILDMMVCDFAIDPGQDVLILLEVPAEKFKVWTLHIWSLASGQIHPEATQPVIEISVAYQSWPHNDGLYPTEIQIHGHLVLFAQRRGPGLSGSISIIDWTSASQVFEMTPVLGNWCCTMLSETELLVVQKASYRSPVALELYQLPGSSRRTAPRTQFQLPFPDHFQDWQSECCFSPASHAAAGGPLAQSNSVPFICPTPQLLAFRFKTTSPCAMQLDMFLLVDQLRNYVHLGDVVPWEVWGPQTTRIFKGALSPHWRRNIHGFRALIPNHNTVIDFNSNLWVEGDPGVVTQASHITIEMSHARTFIFSITSSLPYRKLSPRQPFGSDPAILGNDIVCIKMDANDRGKMKSLKVLRF